MQAHILKDSYPYGAQGIKNYKRPGQENCMSGRSKVAISSRIAQFEGAIRLSWLQVDEIIMIPLCLLQVDRELSIPVMSSQGSVASATVQLRFGWAGSIYHLLGSFIDIDFSSSPLATVCAHPVCNISTIVFGVGIWEHCDRYIRVERGLRVAVCSSRTDRDLFGQKGSARLLSRDLG